MKEKKCSKCGKVKPLTTEFYHRCSKEKTGFKSRCKVCKSIDCKEYRKKNIERLKQYQDDNKEHLKEYNKQYRDDNKERLKIQAKQYQDDNKERLKEYKKEYRQRTKQIRNEQHKERYKNDPQYKIKVLIRTRLKDAVRQYKLNKKEKTLDYLGCSISELFEHLQQTAIDNGYNDFNIYDYDGSEYHIDHIIPFKAIDDGNSTLEEVSHYSNMQILSATENLSKRDLY